MEEQIEEFKELLWEFGNERYSDGCDDSSRPTNKTRPLNESYQELIQLYKEAISNGE